MRVILFVLLVACSGIETATVSPLRTPCQQTLVPSMCLTLDDEVVLDLDGFTHRWGVEAEVHFRRISNGPKTADIPPYEFELESIVTEAHVALDPFEIEFPSKQWFNGAAPAVRLLDGTTVRCDAALCDELVARSDGESRFTVTFELTEDDQTLQALAVR